MKRHLMLALAALTALSSLAAPKTKKVEFALKPGENEIAVEITPNEIRTPFSLSVYRAGVEKPRTLTVAYTAGGFDGGGILHDWTADVSWDAYARKRTSPPENLYSNAVVRVFDKERKWFGVKYALLPYFTPFTGLYRHATVAANIDRWLAEYPLYPERTFVFTFRHDAAFDRVEGYLDGSYAGKWTLGEDGGSGTDAAHPLTKVVVEAGEAAQTVATTSCREPSVFYRLPSAKRRAHARLVRGAKLTLDPAVEREIRASMDVWEPSESVDQGRHKPTNPVRTLSYDPQSHRTPWLTGPEFIQWTVPCAFYCRADVLCADLPQSNRVPTVGLSLTRFGTKAAATSFVSLAGAATNEAIRVVGALEYRDADGRAAKTPLYLVTMRVNPFAILQHVNNLHIFGKTGKEGLPRELQTVDDYLDLEFVGAGTWEGHPRSSVQVFGCSLAKLDYSVRMDQSVRGNLFERGSDVPETGMAVTAETDRAKGLVKFRIFDPFFKTLREGSQAFEIARKGETRRLSFDLDQPEVGWYGVDFTFCEATGLEIGTHEASFTILAPDDREAGCESPFAAWPLGGGYHNSDPDRRQQAIVMRKAGYRGSWQPPVTNENEFGWPLTKTSLGLNLSGKGGGHFCNPCSKRSAEELEKWLDRAVAHFRGELEKFPSCRYIQLLHEQGGRDVASCLYDPKKPVSRGEYKGIDGDWDVYYCTEYAKRMRKEFPNLKIFVGNGSVSSEKIVDLVRRGFDLSLVDQLGIESKGFATPPELSCHRESPGCLWALGETGRYFGYSNLTLNACNEYVFRPERRIDRGASRDRIMRMTNFAVRDLVITLAHGCGIISIGHLEDANDSYYDTNWGCGGQCTFYPFSYPKRMYTALAVATRVLDKAKLVRALPTGGNSTYALEFARERKAKDWAYVCWTQQFDAKMHLEFERGANVRAVDVWGRERKIGGTSVDTGVGPTPCYFLSDRPCAKVTLPESLPPTGTRYRKICDLNLSTLKPCERMGRPVTTMAWGLFTTAYGMPSMPMGTWSYEETVDPVVGKALKLKLDRSTPAPSPLLWEAGQLALKKPVPLRAGKGAGKVALLVKGNGGCGCVALGYDPKMPGTHYCFGRTYVNFDGWRYVEMQLPETFIRKPLAEIGIESVLFGTGRKALNPMEMAEVQGDLAIEGLYEVCENEPNEAATAEERRAAEVMARDVGDKDK